MPSNISGLIQTIVSLRQLQLQEQAQRLSEQQLGISRGNEQTGAQSGFQSTLQGLANPQALLPFVDQYTQQTGLSPDALRTLIQNTPPSVSTTKGAAVSSGARQLGGSQDVGAATTELTGMTPGGAARDAAIQGIFQHVPEYFNSMSPEDRGGVSADIIQQIASGQDVGSAAMSRITKHFIDNAPPEVKNRIVEIGKGLAPGASEQAQLQLGYANYRLNERQTEMQLGFEDLRTRAALAESRNKIDQKSFDDANQLIEKRSDLLTNFTKNSATLTPEGAQGYVDQFNAFNEQLRQIAPNIYGPKGTHPLLDMPKGGTPGAQGVLPFLSSWLSKAPGQ